MRRSLLAERRWGHGALPAGAGLAGTVRVVRVLERSPGAGPRGLVLALRERVLESLDADSSDARALVAGSVCGHTGAMAGRGLEELFSRCGVSHLVAVSGGHLVLVNALAGMALGRTRLRPPARSALLVLVTGLFVTFCGAPLSAVRSWAMSASAELSRLVGRRTHPLSSASFVSLVMALVDPGVTGQLGYLLSVVCVCGICALGPYASYVLRVLLAGRRARGPHGRLRASRAKGGRGRPRGARPHARVPGGDRPLTCSTFGTLSLVAPLANVLLAPLFSVLLALGLASALFRHSAAGPGAVPGRLRGRLPAAHGDPAPALRPALRLRRGERRGGRGAGGACRDALAALLAAWLMPRVSRRALLALGGALLATGLCWYLRWRCFAPACVRVLDVGQGDAILVTDGPGAVLVDTGHGDAVVGALARSNVTHLDAVVLTHLHADHAGGLDALLGVVDVDLLVLPEGTDASGLAEGVAREEVGYGDVLRVGGFSMRVVSPLEPTDGEGNEGSLELLVTYARGGRELTALLAADAESEETGAAVERGDVGDVDLLKVGHHGSRASLTPEIAAALAPEVSVASAGEGNGYGHPDPRCEETLEAYGVQLPVHHRRRRHLRGAGGLGPGRELPARGGAVTPLLHWSEARGTGPAHTSEGGGHGRERRAAACLSIVGPDELKRSQALARLRARVDGPFAMFNVEEIVASPDLEAVDLLSSLNTLPMGGGRRVVIIEADKLPRRSRRRSSTTSGAPTRAARWRSSP